MKVIKASNKTNLEHIKIMRVFKFRKMQKNETNFLEVTGHRLPIYLFKVNNEKTRTLSEIYSKLTIKTQERRKLTDFAHCPGVSISSFEQVNTG